MLFVGVRWPILFSVCHLATLGGDTGYTKSGQVGQGGLSRLATAARQRCPPQGLPGRRGKREQLRQSSGTPRQSWPCGPTRTFGRETTTAPGPSSTPSSALLRTRCGLTGCSACSCAGQRP